MSIDQKVIDLFRKISQMEDDNKNNKNFIIDVDNDDAIDVDNFNNDNNKNIIIDNNDKINNNNNLKLK